MGSILAVPINLHECLSDNNMQAEYIVLDPAPPKGCSCVDNLFLVAVEGHMVLRCLQGILRLSKVAFNNMVVFHVGRFVCIFIFFVVVGANIFGKVFLWGARGDKASAPFSTLGRILRESWGLSEAQ